MATSDQPGGGVAEEPDRDHGAAASGGIGPAALAFPLGQTDTLDPRAAAFFEKQTVLIEKQSLLADLQIEDAREQQKLHMSHLKLQRLRDWVIATWEVSLTVFGLALVIAFGVAVWDAKSAGGLAIEPFTTPPDFDQRGLTGQVLANALLDRLTSIQEISDANAPRAAQSYLNSWGSDIKVAIPQTGISVGDLNRYLRSWLGHETHISGEIYRNAGHVTIIARIAGATAAVSGSDDNLEAMLQRVAEMVYRRTQPYRYSSYLAASGKFAESVDLLREIVQSGAPEDRPWALLNLGYVELLAGHFERAIALNDQAIRLNPSIPLAYDNIAFAALALGHDEVALRTLMQVKALNEKGRNLQYNERAYALEREIELGNLAAALGEFSSAATHYRNTLRLPDFSNNRAAARFWAVDSLSRAHDISAARTELASIAPKSALERVQAAASLFTLERSAGHWKQALVAANLSAALVTTFGPNQLLQGYVRSISLREPAASVAWVLGIAGNRDSARRLIDRTPVDCYVCVRVRGRLDYFNGKLGDANY